MILTGLIGFPIAQSFSPAIHEKAFQISGLSGRYQSFEIRPELLAQTLAHCEKLGFTGVNITIPFKEAVLDLLDELSPEAERVGAVNTVSFIDGRRKGFNTDLHGFAAPLVPFAENLKNKSALLVGAGGAARSVVHVLLHRFGVANVTVSNRTPERAEALRHTCTEEKLTLGSYPPDDFSGFQVVVNATPVKVVDEKKETPFGSKQIFYDLRYNPPETGFLKKAAEAGAHTIGGLPMLVHQALESFRIWTGCDLGDRAEEIIGKLSTFPE